MNKLRLIIAREYMSIVGRKSFIILTLLFPFLMIAIGSIPILMAYMNDKGDQMQQIAVIDETGRYAAALPNDNKFNFVAINGDTVTNARDFYDKSKGSISAVIRSSTHIGWIRVASPPGISSGPRVFITKSRSVEVK